MTERDAERTEGEAMGETCQCPNCGKWTCRNCLISCGQCGRMMCGHCRAPLTRASYHCVPCGRAGSWSYKPDPDAKRDRT